MKKYLSIFVLILVIVSMTETVSAAETTKTESIVYFEDGSYLITTIVQSASRAFQTTSGSAIKRFVDASGNLQWQITLSGTFIYDGSIAACTASSIDVTIYDTTYFTISKSAGKSQASATGIASIGKRILGVTVSRDTYDLTLTCSPTGNLS